MMNKNWSKVLFIVLFVVLSNTSLFAIDSDNDGISDSDENKYWFLDPNDSSDANSDYDRDGINNKDEIILGSKIDTFDEVTNFFDYQIGNEGYKNNATALLEGVGGEEKSFKIFFTPKLDGLKIVEVEKIDSMKSFEGYDIIAKNSSLYGVNVEDGNLSIVTFLDKSHLNKEDTVVVNLICKYKDKLVKIPFYFKVYAKVYAQTVGDINIGGMPQAVAVSGNIAYVGDFDNATIKLYDISDPKNIKYLKSFNVGEATITDLFIDNQRMYASLGSEGVAIIDIAEPKNPKLIKTKETGREYWDIFGQSLRDRDYSIGDEYVYAIDNKQGILDIFDKDLNIVKSLQIGSSEFPSRVFVTSKYYASLSYSGIVARYIFVSNPNKGLIIYYAPGKNFDKLQKVYENSNFSPSDVRNVNNTLSIKVNGKTYIINGIHTDGFPYIAFGNPTYKLQVDIWSDADNNIHKNITVEKLKSIEGDFDPAKQEYDYSINISGYIANSYNGLAGGMYEFNFFDNELNNINSIKTSCYGSFDYKGNMFICANKNSKKLEIYSIDSNLTLFYIKKGWSLKSLPIKTAVDIKNFTDAKIIWKWNSQDAKWEVNSNDSSIKLAIDNLQSVDIFDKISYNDGFWIYSTKENILNLTNKSSADDNSIILNSGWNLVGFLKNKTPEELKNELNNLKIIWQYKDEKWYLWGKNIDDKYYKKYPKIKTISADEGVWILKK